LLFSFVSSYAQSSEPTYLKYDPSGSNAWYPYYTNGTDQPGILPEILELIFLDANIIGEKVTFPPKRTNYALEKGDIDFDLISLDWLPEPVNHTDYVYSEGIIPIKEYFVTRADYRQKIDRNNLTNVGVVRGYIYHDQGQYSHVYFSSERELIIALDKKRVEVIISGDRPASYWANKLNIQVSFTQLHSQGMLRFRLRKEFSHLLPAINLAIDKLQFNGAMQKIIAGYIHF